MKGFFKMDSPLWSFLQYGVARLAVALKFLILARLLGPESIGLLGVALLAIAFVESCTDLGFAQALIQKNGEPSEKEIHAAWTYQLMRGVGIAVVVWLGAGAFAGLLNAPEGEVLIALSALILLARNASNINLVLSQRGQKFRSVSLFNSAFSVFDMACGVAIALLTENIFFVFVSVVVVEVSKSIASYLFFENKSGFNFDAKNVRDFASYGRWIWASSSLSFLLNQIDKIVVSRLLGVFDMGIYQVAQRIAQLGIADFGVALGQYLFPRLSFRFRNDRDGAFVEFSNVLLIVFEFSLMLCMILISVAPLLIGLLLGNEWDRAVIPFQIILPGMLSGVVTALLVAFLRAEGRASVVTYASLFQLIVFVPLLAFLASRYGVSGVAASSSISISLASFYMLIYSIVNFREFRACIFHVKIEIFICFFSISIFLFGLMDSMNFSFLGIFIVFALSARRALIFWRGLA